MIPRNVRRNPWVRTTVFLGLLLSALSLAYMIWDILALFFLSFFFAYMLDPAVDFAEEQLQVNRVTAVILLLTLICFLAVVLGYFLTTQLIVVTQTLGELEVNLQEWSQWVKPFLPAALAENVDPLVKSLETDQAFDFQRLADYIRTNLVDISDTLQEGSFFLVGFARQTLGGVIGVTVNAMVLIFVTIYFLKDFDELIVSIRKLIPRHLRPSTDELFKEVDDLLRAFLRGHLVVSVTIGILLGSGYMLVGLEGGFLVGFLSGVMNVIPYVGPSLGFLLAVGLGLYQFGFSLPILGILAVFVFVQSLEGNVLTPNIVGGAVGLNPVTVIFALLVFGKFFGFVGLLLAIPSAGVLKVLLRRLYRYYRSTEFYRGKSRARDSS